MLGGHSAFDVTGRKRRICHSPITALKFITIVGCVCFLVLIGYIIHTSSEGGDTERSNESWIHLAALLTRMLQRKFKIVLSFYQVVTAIPTSYPVQFPIGFQNIAN